VRRVRCTGFFNALADLPEHEDAEIELMIVD
jgi:hypothetical protein